MKKNLQKYWFCLFVMFLEACANVVTPSGGAKDVTPPKVIKSIPELNSKNFKGKSVRIDFDEFVKVTDAASQLMVSPFMKETPEIKLKGKHIVIDFKDTLKSNTTYSVSFGKSIADINEGNVLTNYRYIFSTGNIIDSLTLKGFIKNAFTLKAESGIFVMLYDNAYDSVPYKEMPYYISKSDESGSFSFTNIKNGKYKIFALKDANSNYLFDQPDEMIAFSDSLVTPQPIDTAKADSLRKNKLYNLSLFEEIPATQKMLKAFAAKYGKIVLVFRKPVEDLSIIPLTKNLPVSWDFQEINKTKDTITLWLKNPDMDSLVFKVLDNNIILDTAEISLVKKSAKQNRGKGEEVKNVGIKACVSNNGTFDFYKPFTIESSTPVSDYNFSKIVFIENKDTGKVVFTFTDSIRKNIKMEYKWKEGTAYSLFIPPGTFKDIFGTSNDTVKINFKTTSAKDYSNIKLSLISHDLTCNLIVRLVTENDAIIQEIYSPPDKAIQFNYVLPGNYKIKVICDSNNNKKWDTGNYLKKIQPEKVFYYPSAITTKANWDVSLDWEIK